MSARMTAPIEQRTQLFNEITDLIDTTDLSISQPSNDYLAQRDELLLKIATLQRDHIPTYAHWLDAHPCKRHPNHISQWPALPTEAFKYASISLNNEAPPIRTFRTSGTTTKDTIQPTRGSHHFHTLDLYKKSAKKSVKHALFTPAMPKQAAPTLLILTATEKEAADSSLSFMFSQIADWCTEWFNSEPPIYVWENQRLDIERYRRALDRAQTSQSPLCILGTSFAFVHAEDALQTYRWSLPKGSQLLHTGGFKGKSRTVEPKALKTLLCRRYGLPTDRVRTEYGMTELSSQCYETATQDERKLGIRYWIPPWVRISIIDPETQKEKESGQPGLIRVDDPANLDSVATVQTSDSGIAYIDDPGHIQILGRTEEVAPRGCSIQADALLSDTTNSP